jgi:hypothetical protein
MPFALTSRSLPLAADSRVSSSHVPRDSRVSSSYVPRLDRSCLNSGAVKGMRVRSCEHSPSCQAVLRCQEGPRDRAQFCPTLLRTSPRGAGLGGDPGVRRCGHCRRSRRRTCPLQTEQRGHGQLDTEGDHQTGSGGPGTRATVIARAHRYTRRITRMTRMSGRPVKHVRSLFRGSLNVPILERAR